MLQNATPGAAAKEVIITAIDKRAALLEQGVSPGGLLLAKWQRLPNKAKREREVGEQEQEEEKGKLCEVEHTVEYEGDCGIVCVCAAYPFLLTQLN